MNLKDYIAKVENYPEEGIIFRDITPLMADGDAFKEATQQIVNYAALAILFTLCWVGVYLSTK